MCLRNAKSKSLADVSDSPCGVSRISVYHSWLPHGRGSLPPPLTSPLPPLLTSPVQKQLSYNRGFHKAGSYGGLQGKSPGKRQATSNLVNGRSLAKTTFGT